MPCCGPKVSTCCTILSVWAVIMLVIMGFLLKWQSLAFVEDLGVEEGNRGEDHRTMEQLYEAIKEKYDISAFNCWLAAGLYGVTFLVSLHQFYYNMKSSTSGL